eukprot:1957883-Amphidinium_carterae.2
MCPSDTKVVVSCEDAKDYFYLLGAPRARIEESSETLVGFGIPAQCLSATSSERLEVAGDSQKLDLLVRATVLLFTKRAARVIEVRRIVGYWTHFCLLSRHLLSLLSAVYERVLRPMSARVRDEFWGLVLLHPYMRAQ